MPAGGGKIAPGAGPSGGRSHRRASIGRMRTFQGMVFFAAFFGNRSHGLTPIGNLPYCPARVAKTWPDLSRASFSRNSPSISAILGLFPRSHHQLFRRPPLSPDGNPSFTCPAGQAVIFILSNMICVIGKKSMTEICHLVSKGDDLSLAQEEGTEDLPTRGGGSAPQLVLQERDIGCQSRQQPLKKAAHFRHFPDAGVFFRGVSKGA